MIFFPICTRFQVSWKAFCFVWWSWLLKLNVTWFAKSCQGWLNGDCRDDKPDEAASTGETKHRFYSLKRQTSAQVRWPLSQYRWDDSLNTEEKLQHRWGTSVSGVAEVGHGVSAVRLKKNLTAELQPSEIKVSDLNHLDLSTHVVCSISTSTCTQPHLCLQDWNGRQRLEMGDIFTKHFINP